MRRWRRDDRSLPELPGINPSRPDLARAGKRLVCNGRTAEPPGFAQLASLLYTFRIASHACRAMATTCWQSICCERLTSRDIVAPAHQAAGSEAAEAAVQIVELSAVLMWIARSRCKLPSHPAGC